MFRLVRTRTLLALRASAERDRAAAFAARSVADAEREARESAELTLRAVLRVALHPERSPETRERLAGIEEHFAGRRGPGRPS